MKNMNYIKSLIAIFVLSILISSCYKEDYTWFEDNTTTIGVAPVLESISIEGDNTVGATKTVTIGFWSTETIESIKLIQTINGIDTEISSNSVSDATRRDLENIYDLTIQYTVPNEAVGTDITLKGLVTNTNGITADDDDSFTIE
ncbi:MAG: hypothetical protein ABFS35_22610 [Bacteroidota bacterium]